MYANRQDQNRVNQGELSVEEKAMIQRIINADEDAAELTAFALRVADRIVNDRMTTSQIRNIFSEARQIEGLWEKDSISAKRRLELLKPKLRYQAKRENSIDYYAKVLYEAIDNVTKSDDIDKAFAKLMDFFEASLAYHKYLGGKD